MGGLLDFLNTDQGRMGLGLLAAAGPRSDGAGFGQRLQEGMGQFDAYKANALKQRMLEAQMQQAMEQSALQKAEQSRQQTIRQGMGQFFKPGQQSLSPLVGDASIGIMPSAGRDAVAPSFDAAGAAQFLADNGDYEQALKLMPKPKELQINKLNASDFTPASLAKFAKSQNYGDLERLEKASFQNTGSKTYALNPFTGLPLNSIENTQDPNSRASVAATLRGQNLTDRRARERLNFDMNGGADSGGATQMGLNKQFGKPQAGYRWKPDGSMEFIPGGPADQKAQMKTSGEGTVDSVVADLRDKYTQLNEGGGIVNDKDGALGNIGARIASTGLGQTVGGAVGTRNQTSRDNIAMTRPLLLQAIMKATGMSAKQMDSNAELKLYLATATDPTRGYQANMDALQRIEELYGGGKKDTQPTEPAKQAPAANLMEKLPTANASNKGKKIRDTTTGKVLVSNGMTWTEAP